jgi:hypothetical protein
MMKFIVPANIVAPPQILVNPPKHRLEAIVFEFRKQKAHTEAVLADSRRTLTWVAHLRHEFGAAIQARLYDLNDGQARQEGVGANHNSRPGKSSWSNSAHNGARVISATTVLSPGSRDLLVREWLSIGASGCHRRLSLNAIRWVLRNGSEAAGRL